MQRYLDAKARIRYLRSASGKLSRELDRLVHTEYGVVGDTVSRGKRGKKSLGTVKISGFPVPEHQRISSQLKLRNKLLKAEEVKLAKMTNDVEQFIESVEDIEMRNILSLYYIEDMTWLQVANEMNILYGKDTYSSESCRKKHNRFIKKNEIK